MKETTLVEIFKRIKRIKTASVDIDELLEISKGLDVLLEKYHTVD